MRWSKKTHGTGSRKKGRIIWIAILCLSLLSGSSLARLTGQILIQRAVYGVVNPVCGLAVFSGLSDQENIWQRFFREIVTAPIPILSYLECNRTEETAVTDPIYERYLSSEVLYNGGGPLLPDGTADGANETGVNQENEGQGGNEGQAGPDSGDGSGLGEDGSLAEPVSAGVQTHLPQTAAGSLYTLSQLRNFDYLVRQLYFVHSSTTVYPEQLNVDELLAKDLTIDKETQGAQILIHHTHGTEAFADSVEGEGMTILEVGDYLTELLESYGYTVIHDKSIYPYDTAYSEACARAREILAANPTIQVVIDLHRDATGSMKRFIAEVDGETVAQLMFFNGMCQTPEGPIDYLNNPYLEDNLAFSLQMKLLAEAYYPGLTRPNFLKAYQYNQHLMPRYTLVEAGTDTNTFEEVCRSMVPLAAILDAVLSDPNAVRLAGEE